MKSKLLLLLSIIFLSYNSFATIRFVSKTGLSTSPYLTWETASDSIQKCINVCSYGDTIFVANGIYYEKVIMIPGLALIGGGADSCIIDGHTFTDPQLVQMNDYCLLKNFKILAQSNYDNNSSGVIMWNCPNAVCEYNEVRNGGLAGVRCRNTNSIVRHNKILNSGYCIWVEFGQPTIDSNYIYLTESGSNGVFSDLGCYPTIRGNTIIGLDNRVTIGIASSSLCIGGLIQNNLIYAYSLRVGISPYSDEHIYNNTVAGNYRWGIYSGNHPVIENNTITGGQTGVLIVGDPRPVYRYNNVWNNSRENYYNLTPDSTNISVDPMFVSEDSLDFHLQMYSPLINAGDPDILDRDSSRSDIGVYGGPLGELYSYKDLAPRTPVGLSALIDSSSEEMIIRWRKNTEADFKGYRLYRDTTAGFTADSTTLLSELPDTFYTHIVPPGVNSYYYKIAAFDSQGNQSEISEELPVIISSAEGLQELREYRLFQNYPNPFNPHTTIGYRLKNRSYVKLYIFDIKGERISAPVNQMQSAGYYEVDFSAEGLASGIYLYQIIVKDENNLLVYTEIKKMLLIK